MAEQEHWAGRRPRTHPRSRPPSCLALFRHSNGSCNSSRNLPKRFERTAMVRGAEGLQRRDDERRLVDRAVDAGFEVALEPARRHPAAPTRIGLRDQRGELEQVDERRPRYLSTQHRFGHGEVAALDRPFEDRPRMSRRRQRASLDGWGRTADADSTRASTLRARKAYTSASLPSSGCNQEAPPSGAFREGERMMGLEPTTFCMASRRSSQLSYIRERGQYSPRSSVPRSAGQAADSRAAMAAATA